MFALFSIYFKSCRLFYWLIILFLFIFLKLLDPSFYFTFSTSSLAVKELSKIFVYSYWFFFFRLFSFFLWVFTSGKLLTKSLILSGSLKSMNYLGDVSFLLVVLFSLGSMFSSCLLLHGLRVSLGDIKILETRCPFELKPDEVMCPSILERSIYFNIINICFVEEQSRK